VNITIDIKDKRYTVDEDVAQYLFCLRTQITSLNKALEIANQVQPPRTLLADDGSRVEIVPPPQRPFKGKR